MLNLHQDMSTLKAFFSLETIMAQQLQEKYMVFFSTSSPTKRPQKSILYIRIQIEHI